MDKTEQIIFVSNQNVSIICDRQAAMSSKLVEAICEDIVDWTDQTIPLPNVNTTTLYKVVEFMGKQASIPMNAIPKPLLSTNLGVQDDYVKFVNLLTQEELFDLIHAANYMDIPPLLDLTCAKVASMIKGKTPNEIRRSFNIVNDFSPTEEAQLREDNSWHDNA